MSKAYKISRWEKVFGGDLWRLRNVMRRIVSVPFACIPVRAWRHNARERFDLWLVRLNREKIRYFIDHYPQVKTELETIERIVATRASIARFGDGEFNMCIGRNKSFQDFNEELVSRLRAVLKCNEKNLLIGINTIKTEDDLTDIWKKFVVRRGNRVLSLLDPERTYDSSTITTEFPLEADELDVYVSRLKRIWADRKVVFVVGKGSRFFYEDDLFNNIREYVFVYGPAKNAFDQYDEILKRVLEFDRDWLIMIALGPTATIMAYDLHAMGYQAIDLGQTPSKYHRAKYGTLYPDDMNQPEA